LKEIIVVGLIFIIVGLIGQYYLQKKFRINGKANNISKSIKRIQRIILGVAFIVYMVIIATSLIKYDDFNIVFVLIPFIMIISFVRGFTQWKYNRHANVWILELFTVFILIFLLVTMSYIIGG